MFPLRRIKDTNEMKVTSAFGLKSSDDHVTCTFHYCINLFKAHPDSIEYLMLIKLKVQQNKKISYEYL